MTLEEVLSHAHSEHKAIGHFNISTLEMLRAIAAAAKELQTPVMIGTSEGEAAFIGYTTAVAMTHAVAAEFAVPLFLNADHHKSVDAAKRAVDAGYDSVHIDLSKEPYEKNLAGTKAVADYARASGRNISVEGELGYLPTDSSKMFNEAVAVNPEDFTKPEQAREFTEKTGVNRFAPAVGNFHGISTAQEKNIDFERLKDIREAIPAEVALVLHGGSGISHDQLKHAIVAGISNVHISTELRVAYANALKKTFSDNPAETTPYKLLAPSIKAVESVVREKLQVFNTI